MQKIDINTNYGGFSLSREFIEEYNKKAARPVEYHWEIPRDEPALVEIVEREVANGNSEIEALRVIEIPDDVKWQIREYDGSEWVAEVHRTWEYHGDSEVNFP